MFLILLVIQVGARTRRIKQGQTIRVFKPQTFVIQADDQNLIKATFYDTKDPNSMMVLSQSQQMPNFPQDLIKQRQFFTQYNVDVQGYVAQTPQYQITQQRKYLHMLNKGNISLQNSSSYLSRICPDGIIFNTKKGQCQCTDSIGDLCQISGKYLDILQVKLFKQIRKSQLYYFTLYPKNDQPINAHIVGSIKVDKAIVSVFVAKKNNFATIPNVYDQSQIVNNDFNFKYATDTNNLYVVLKVQQAQAGATLNLNVTIESNQEFTLFYILAGIAGGLIVVVIIGCIVIKCFLKSRENPKIEIIERFKQQQIDLYFPSFKLQDYKLYQRECSICIVNINSDDDATVLPCGHIFHKDCFKQWLARKQNCPYCRQQISLCKMRQIMLKFDIQKKQVIDQFLKGQLQNMQKQKNYQSVSSTIFNQKNQLKVQVQCL